jgi:transposase-like protein
MQVKIENECFFDNKNTPNLDKIFGFFKSEKHKWLGIDLTVLETSDWFIGLGERDKNDIKKISVGSTRPSSKSKTISINNNKSDNFSVDEAYLYLNQPLTIVVENYEYEPVFINCIFKHFSLDLLEAKNKHFLKFENGAGKNDNAIKGMLKELFNDIVFSKNKETYLRCYSIKDSDRKYCIDPNELPESTNTYLKENNIPHHILYKRAKENYMPNSVLEKSDNEYFKTILRVFKDDLKRDFFDFTNGFNNKNKTDKDWKTTKKEEYDFFDIKNVDNSDFNILKKGVEKKEGFKRSFSNQFEYVTRQDLEKRIQHQPKLTSKVNPKDTTERNEFEHIVHEIKYLL